MMDSHHHSHLPTIQALAGLATGGGGAIGGVQQDTKQHPMGQFQQRQPQQQQPLVNTQSQNHQLLHFHHSPAVSQTSVTASHQQQQQQQQHHPYSTLSHLNNLNTQQPQQPAAHLNMINQLQHLSNTGIGNGGGLFSSSTLHHPTSSQNSASSQATSMTGGSGSGIGTGSGNQSNHHHLQQYFNTTNPHLANHLHHQHPQHHLMQHSHQLFLNQTSGCGGGGGNGPPSSHSSTGKQQFANNNNNNQQQHYNMNSSDYSSSTYHVYDQILGDQIIDDLIVIKQERMKKKREQEQKRKVILIGLAAILLVGLMMFLIVKLFDVTSSQQPSALLRFDNNNNNNNMMMMNTNSNHQANDLQQTPPTWNVAPPPPPPPSLVYPGRPHWGAAPPSGVQSKQPPPPTNGWDFDSTVDRSSMHPLLSTHRPPQAYPPTLQDGPAIQLPQNPYQQHQQQPPVIIAQQPTSPPALVQPAMDSMSNHQQLTTSTQVISSSQPALIVTTGSLGEQETGSGIKPEAVAPSTTTTSDISNNHDNNNLRGCHGHHCPSAGCPNNCSQRGQCVKQPVTASSSASTSGGAGGDQTLWLQQQQQQVGQEWKCQCAPGSTGDDCSILIERQCDDKIDNDKDGLIDCADSECCSDHVCQNSTLCMKSPDPLEILMRKQPLPPTASFFQRMQFLIDNTQIYTTPSSFNDSRASVLRGRVTYQKQGVIGVRVSIANQRHAGITLSRDGGYFDLIVNGGGAVTVDFLREPFAALQKTVRVPWNEIVLVDSIELQLDLQPSGGQLDLSSGSTDVSDTAGPICSAHNYSFLRPQIMAAPNSIRNRQHGASSGGSGPLARSQATSGKQVARAIILRDSAIVQHSIPLPESSYKSSGASSSISNQRAAKQLQVTNATQGNSRNANANNSQQDQEPPVSLVYISSRASEFMSTINIQLTPQLINQIEQQRKLSDELKQIHLKIVIEGILFEQSFEPQMNLSFTYAWNRRNVYRQKVFGLSTAAVSVGYEYFDCRQVIWSTKHLQLSGHDLAISDIGDSWSLSLHHRYNYREAILQRGDGQNFNLKSQRPRVVVPVMGDGYQRQLMCPFCDGATSPGEQKLLKPQALVSAPDGAIYVGDYNLIRRIEPAPVAASAGGASSGHASDSLSSSERVVRTVLEFPPGQVPESGYALALNLAGPEAPRLYMTDTDRHQVHLVRDQRAPGGAAADSTTSNETTPPSGGGNQAATSGSAAAAAAAWDEAVVPVVGSGQRCAPDEPLACGDRGPALQARLIEPKALAFDLVGRMYLADGPNVRLIDLDQQIYTLLGDYSPTRKHTKFPCTPGEAIPMHKFVPKWPLDVALNPLDETLHVLDENIVYKITQDKRVQIVAGRPAHCRAGGASDLLAAATGSGQPLRHHNQQQQRASEVFLQSARSIAFNQAGHLFISEDSSSGSRVLVVSPEDDTIGPYAGAIVSSSESSPSSDVMEVGGKQQQHHRMSNTILLGMDASSNNNHHSNNHHNHLNHHQHHTTALAQRAADFRFQSISGLALDQRGHLLVADKLALRVVSIEPDLPQINQADEYEILAPDNPNELLIFNKHGHQIYTRELVPAAGPGHTSNTKRALLPSKYTFTYTVNTPFGQLAHVRYANGNKISTYRDSHHSVKMIEVDFGGQCQLDVARNGQVHSIAITGGARTTSGGGDDDLTAGRALGSSGATKIIMSYHIGAGGGSLLKQSRDQASGETYDFTYDEFGRALAIQHSSPRLPQPVECRLQQQQQQQHTAGQNALLQSQVCPSLIVAE